AGRASSGPLSSLLAMLPRRARRARQEIPQRVAVNSPHFRMGRQTEQADSAGGKRLAPGGAARASHGGRGTALTPRRPPDVKACWPSLERATPCIATRVVLSIPNRGPFR